jgi:hypothetical protein
VIIFISISSRFIILTGCDRRNYSKSGIICQENKPATGC